MWMAGCQPGLAWRGIRLGGDLMANCPDCGSIVMEGDPYCSHCGAHIVWIDDDSDDDY